MRGCGERTRTEKDRGRDTETDTASFPEQPRLPGLGQADTRKPALHPGFPPEPSLLLPRVFFSTKLELVAESQVSNPGTPV